MLFSRSGPMLTHEATSPWTSLMARELSLGPSDAPCLGEASTAHGDSLFSVKLIPIKTVTSSKSSALATVYDLSSTNLLIPEISPSRQSLSTPQLPATTTPTQICFSPTSSRRTINTNASIEKSLGFPFLDPFLSGPSVKIVPQRQPICEKRGPTSLFNWTRYALYNPLFSPLHCLPRLINWNGRRHLFNFVSTPLQWLSYYHARTLVQTSSRVVSADCKLSQEEDSHWISLTAGVNPGPLLASFSVSMSRTHGNSFFWMDLSLFEKFSTLESMKLFSTSHCLLKRTIHHLLELIANSSRL